jgi:ABC-type sugar transport system ATPase subunit
MSANRENTGAVHGTRELLEIRGVSKRFPGVEALREVSLSVAVGEVHGLVGQNGAGKSTLVKCISGVHPPDGGTIVFDGETIGTYSPKHAYDLGIAVVHQRPQLLPWLSVAENVLLGQLPARGGIAIDRRRANEVARALLARFKLDIDPEIAVARLATPERQQVAIAKALFRRAKLLILDEPTAALDAERSERLFRLVDDLSREHVAVLYVSHHLEEVFRLADRITVLRDGQLVATRPTGELTQTEVVTLMAGRRLEAGEGDEASGAPAAGNAAVVFEHVSTNLLRDIHFSLREAEVVGVTGVIGAGGHDIARLLFGLDRPLSGRLLLEGEAYEPRGPKQAIANGLFMVPADPTGEGLVPPLSVSGNITLVDLSAITRFGALSLRRERRIAGRFVDELSIATASVDTPVRNLSGGNQQKVLLAKALTAKAKVLVLEEPTQGVDVHAKAEIHRIIRSLAAEGKAVMVISTDIRDLLEFVDRIVALRNGRIVGDVATTETSYAEILDLTVGSAGVLAS